MKLYREIKQGESWESLLISGIWEHEVADSTPQGFEEVTDSTQTETLIEYLHLLLIALIDNNYCNDYQQVRTLIDDRRESKTWAGCSDSEKDIIIDVYGYRAGDADKVAYLMGKGMSQAEAQIFLINKWHFHHAKFVEDCSNINGRWYYSKREIILRVHKDDIEAFCSQVIIPISEYTQNGIIGSQYGDNNTGGIMDFMESTGGFAGNGFAEQGFTLNDGFSYQDVIDAVKNVIINGIYDRSE